MEADKLWSAAPHEHRQAGALLVYYMKYTYFQKYFLVATNFFGILFSVHFVCDKVNTRVTKWNNSDLTAPVPNCKQQTSKAKSLFKVKISTLQTVIHLKKSLFHQKGQIQIIFFIPMDLQKNSSCKADCLVTDT